MPQLAKDTVKTAVELVGTKPFGPATTVKNYLSQTGWSLVVDGTLDGPDYLQCNLLSDSCKYISETVRFM